MTIKFKKLSDKAVQPVRTTNTGAGYNLTAAAVTTEVNERGQLLLVYHTGIGVEIPDGYEGIIRPLESICAKTVRICGAPYAISGKLEDEVVVRFITTTDVVPAVYKEGEQVAQLVINKVEDIELVEFVDTTEDEQSAAEGSQSPSENEDMSTNSETVTGASGGEENVPEQA